MRYVELYVRCFPCTVEAVDNFVENRFYRQPGMLTMVAKVVSGALKAIAK